MYVISTFDLISSSLHNHSDRFTLSFPMKSIALLLFLSLLPLFSAKIEGLNSVSLKGGDADPAPVFPLRLYAMRFCPWCERVLIYMARKNITADVVNINLHRKPAFMFEKSADGKVPILQHGEKIITDSAAICDYLDVLYPDSSILPQDPELRKRQRQLADELQNIVAPAFYGIIESQKSPSLRENRMGRLRESLVKLETRLENTFYSGDSVGFADYMTYPFVERIWIWSHKKSATDLDLSGFPGKEYPKLAQWFEKMRSLPEVVAVAQPLEKHFVFNEGYIAGTPNYNAGLP